MKHHLLIKLVDECVNVYKTFLYKSNSSLFILKAVPFLMQVNRKHILMSSNNLVMKHWINFN